MTVGKLIVGEMMIFSEIVYLTYLSVYFNFGVNVVSEVLKRRVIVADRVKGAFISSISHELRTVLYGIILDFAKLESEKQDYVEDPINQKKLNEKENDNKIVNKNNKKKKEQKERIDLVKLLLYRIFLEN
ncbi:hypothetical protein RIR_jg2727.t1 [Rhizophagus irregularis DAOM 181602=DAOM 197198]|nr:hypothetical protein RIR_jg2727.t1 [Rhizophagus irregularis DAOM 181602=DAOM 197198]